MGKERFMGKPRYWFGKSRKKMNPLALRLHKAGRQIHFLKIKLFLLITLPTAVISIGQAVLKEYVRIRVREAARKGNIDDPQNL